jgi:hypothetical protein
MTGSGPLDSNSHWAILGPELPADLDGHRVLDVGAAASEDRAEAAEAFRERGAQDVVAWEPPGDLGEPGEPFSLVYCRDALQQDRHPMNFLSRLWHLTSEGALLLLESQILPAPELSRFARFVAGAERGDSSPEWLPGRLALRWSVETSGFDVEGWIDSELEASAGHGRPSAYLRASRAARQPAIDLAIPGPQ